MDHPKHKILEGQRLQNLQHVCILSLINMKWTRKHKNALKCSFYHYLVLVITNPQKYAIRWHYNIVRQCNTRWYLIHYCSDQHRTQMIVITHKIHRIYHPHGRAMRCLLYVFGRNLTVWHCILLWVWMDSCLLLNKWNIHTIAMGFLLPLQKIDSVSTEVYCVNTNTLFCSEAMARGPSVFFMEKISKYTIVHNDILHTFHFNIIFYPFHIPLVIVTVKYCFKWCAAIQIKIFATYHKILCIFWSRVILFIFPSF